MTRAEPEAQLVVEDPHETTHYQQLGANTLQSRSGLDLGLNWRGTLRATVPQNAVGTLHP